ncbi:MAG: ArgE/DapE family deacylase [Proteobacteria bacterium]|nr:ArgE/DapE family deacylase [Pseudomonadota bacterium]MBU2467901.1 ArgE/DapE family deacylase [Pseudomonadota bacterium]MBU2517523.1 ArgE/DapE family deacylase [Pseudomonadota bacterium]
MQSAEIKQLLFSAVDELRPQLVQTLRELVAIPSVVGQEARAQDYMEKLYQELDLKVERVAPDMEAVRAHHAFIDTGVSYQNRPNLVATLPGDPKRPSLAINGHVDVVSPEPLEAWTRDPWGGQVENGRLYGRGSADMKSGLLANYFALKAALSAGLRPGGMVRLMSVIDEEAGGSGGTLACLLAGYRADALLITEPHGMNVTVANAGVNHFRVYVPGRSAHGGISHLGVNAIGKALPIYQALADLDERRGREVRYELFEKGSGRSCHVTVGTMRSGDWPSTVPGDAVMECRVSFVPGESKGQIRALVEDTVAQAAAKDPWLREHPPRVEWFGWQTDPWQQDPEHPFVQALLGAAQEVAGRPVEFIGRASGLDSRFAPDFAMASACTGPKGANIHGIDEYVELDSVVETAKVVGLTMLDWCGLAS